MDETVKRIITRMKEVGLDQKTLAQKIGVRQPTITEWKTGFTSSYTKYLPQLAEVLDTSVAYLVTGKNETDTEKYELSEKEEKFMSKFRALSEKEQDFVLHIMDATSGMQ